MDRLLLALVCIWIAWLYSKTEIDPDWALFNLPAFTGAWYGRDFVDCKSPLIYLWYYGIAKITGPDIKAVKFMHHILISFPGIVVGGWAGLAFIVIINSGWLIAFHGNVSQQPAGFILLALWFHDPWISTALLFLAIAFEPKLITLLLIPILSSWWLPLGTGVVIAGGTALVIWKKWPQVWGWLVEANLTITKRMTAWRWDLIRHGADFTYTSMKGLMYILPWLLLGAYTKPDLKYWLPMIAYIVLNAAGVFIRPNHLMILAPWIALALPWQGVVALFITDWVSGFAYMGDVWNRFYSALRIGNEEARLIGEWLKDKPGTLWVNGIHTAIYIYSGKKPYGGMTEQIEIRNNATERRKAWREAWQKEPPEWVVEGQSPGWTFNPIGYHREIEGNISKIYRRL